MEQVNEDDGRILKMLAQEGHGAVEVDSSPYRVPPIIVLVGPIKIWWNDDMWDSDLHKRYIEWRDAVRVTLVKLGCAVYSPHRAIQGRWNEKLQLINDAAIGAADLVVILTPKGVIAEGTEGEIKIAHRYGIPTYDCPPATSKELREMTTHIVNNLFVENDTNGDR